MFYKYAFEISDDGWWVGAGKFTEDWELAELI